MAKRTRSLSLFNGSAAITGVLVLSLALVMANAGMHSSAGLGPSLSSRAVNNSQGDAVTKERVDTAIRKLWSGSESDRLKGKSEVLQLGPNVIPALVALLEDLLRNPGLRFVPGKEAEGKSAFEAYLRLPTREKTESAFRHLRSLEISSRLKEDTCELLGRLQANEAVSTLIEGLNQPDLGSPSTNMLPEMTALVRIGSASVPAILKTLEDAEHPSEHVTHEQTAGRHEIYLVETRLVVVLREIGDSRALPTLRELQRKTNNKFLAAHVESAIRKINSKR